ncbi:hypothetical protein [Polyangium aurulentum]|uniref:hypothetical protein n=1 Tax=Polyangium aurulentum TaxID=2567896 RepID=UPI0010ADF345|nr:hypothetical protein [Polyangium aurulentum]UQA59477.1 hypothetical protein E8A73_002910 [Polyangium aurulentum]
MTARSSLGLFALLLAACGAPARSDKPATPPRPSPAPSAEKPLGPARYVLTEGIGVSFDESGLPSPLPRREPVIVAGARLALEGGVIVESALAPEPLFGFRSIPARLGGGFVFWSDARTYRADKFFGELTPLADVAARGGVRPWLASIVLRTDLGLLELFPGSLKVERTELGRFSEVLALDAKRGVRVDALGRAEVTTDGGARWTGVKGDHGMPAILTSLQEGKPGTLELMAMPRPIVLGPGDALAPVADETFHGSVWEPQTTPEETQPPSRQLASPDLAAAAFAGARIPGNRALVARAEGLRVIGLESGQIIDDAPWAGVTEPYTRCQPASAGDEVLLACTHARGAHVLVLGGDPSAPRLEATFPDAGGGFVAGLGRRFGRDGRCGSERPGVTDFGVVNAPEGEPAAPNAPPPPPEEPPEADPPRVDQASFCVREGAGSWVERRLEGYDAVRLYRFLPGDAGAVTALVLENARGRKQREKATPAPLPEGIRVLRIDPDDPALGGAVFPVVPPPMEDAPFRAVDADFWLDASDGSVHGWVQLPAEGESGEDEGKRERELVPQGPAKRMLPVSARLGGPFAGVRIGPDGAIEVHPLPPGVIEVARGGRFALARADVEGTATYHETTDGGRTWRPVLAPPVGELSTPYSETAIQGCSALGCALSDGLVRLGWGSPPPPSAPPSPPELEPAKNPAFPRLSSLPLRCHLDAPAARAAKDAEPTATPVSLRPPPGSTLGALRGDTWTADVFSPFDPSPAPRRVTAKIAPLSRIAGDVVPVLTDAAASPVELFLRVDRFRFDLGKEPSRAPVPFTYGPRLAVAAAMGPRQRVALDADTGAVVLVKNDLARSVMRVMRVADVTSSRLTLARGVGGGGKGPARLALATVSATSGDLLLGDLDLERGQVGPLRPAGNLGALDIAPACRPDPLGYRLLADVTVDLRFEPAAPDLEGSYLSATALVSVGAGRACLEGLEVRLPEKDAILAVRFSAPGGALVRQGTAAPARASCAKP